MKCYDRWKNFLDKPIRNYIKTYEVELLTRKKNLYKNLRVSNSKCNIILRNSVS